jgi:hypothetical protein
MVNFRSDEPQYTSQTTFSDISSQRSVNHFGESEYNIRPPLTPISFTLISDHKLILPPSVMYDVPAEAQEFLSDDDLPSLYGYHSPYSSGLPSDGRFQADEDCSACVRPLDLHPPNSDSADPFANTPSFYSHQDTSGHPGTNSLALRPTISTAAGPSDSPAPAPHAGVRLAPQRRRFRCKTCQKTFDRPSRLENCRNRHSNSKPHQCRGACGSSGWYVVFTNPPLFLSVRS